MPHKQALYTLSNRAHQNLFILFSRPHTKTTEWRRRSTYTLSGSGQVYQTSDLEYTHEEGASYGLRTCAITYDLSDWQDVRQDSQALWYYPIDKAYAESWDDTPFQDLPKWEQQTRLDMQQDVRRRFRLALDDYTNSYYAELSKFFEIKPIGTQRTVISYASAAIEAIGSLLLQPPTGYREMLLEEPNLRKSHRDIMHNNQYTKLYGNHAHTPISFREWRALPLLSKFTQEDVDYCMRSKLEDIAELAVQENPSLVIKEKGKGK